MEEYMREIRAGGGYERLTRGRGRGRSCSRGSYRGGRDMRQQVRGVIIETFKY